MVTASWNQFQLAVLVLKKKEKIHMPCAPVNKATRQKRRRVCKKHLLYRFLCNFMRFRRETHANYGCVLPSFAPRQNKSKAAGKLSLCSACGSAVLPWGNGRSSNLSYLGQWSQSMCTKVFALDCIALDTVFIPCWLLIRIMCLTV